jgi:hypothetical protein
MAFDCSGRRVEVGTKVRVLKVPYSLMQDLPPDEERDLRTMIGEVFVICDIDEYAWVEKWWRDEDDRESSRCHSLALGSDEMEVVGGSGE